MSGFPTVATLAGDTQAPAPTGVAAIDDANLATYFATTPPGRYKLQAGTYVINSTKTLPNVGIIEGAAASVNPSATETTPGTVIRLAASFTWGASGYALDATGATDLIIRNVIIDIPSGTVTNPPVPNAAALATANDVLLENVLIRNIQSAGANKIYGQKVVGGGGWIRGKSVNIINCDGSLYLLNPSICIFEDSYFGNAVNGYNLNIIQTVGTNKYTAFIGCVIDESFAGAPSAIIAAACSDVLFDGCVIYAATGQAAISDSGTRTRFVNCYLGPFGSNTGAQGYQSAGAANSTLTNCTIASSASQPCILMSSGNASFNQCNVVPGAGGSVVSGSGAILRGCPGYNPVGTVSPAVPASGTAVAAAVYDRTFYVSTVAGTTSCSMAIQGGPTITFVALTAQVIAVRVPAGQTVTPTYTGTAPTWVVEGE